MTQNQIKNMGASVRQRLRNLARTKGQNFQETILEYAMDRFLYRLAQSENSEKFTLKGGLMFRIWGGDHKRPTKDIDLLGKENNTPEKILGIFRGIAAAEEHDGLEFHADKTIVSDIIKDGGYKGVRVKVPGALAGARFVIQVDIGFGDAVYPHPEIRELPTVLDQPPTRLACYCKETLIAEKFHAMVELGNDNSRMKDFYDIWFLSNTFDFDGTNLKTAIDRAFTRRQSTVPRDLTKLTNELRINQKPRWTAFTKKLEKGCIPDLQTVIDAIACFLQPVCEGLHAKTPPGDWNAEAQTWKRG